jgi:hypothetical protein
MDLENFYVPPGFSDDYQLMLVEYIKPQNTQSARKRQEEHIFFKKKFPSKKKNPCQQGTGLGCPVALLAGFPSKASMCI